MDDRKVTPTQQGMMFGMIAGALIGAVLFVLTGEVLWLGAVGVGVALGLGIGASMERRGR